MLPLHNLRESRSRLRLTTAPATEPLTTKSRRAFAARLILLLFVQILASSLSLYQSRVITPLPGHVTNSDLIYRPSLSLLVSIFLTFDASSFVALFLAVTNGAALLFLVGSYSSNNWARNAVTWPLVGLCIISTRMAVGFLFSRALGWAHPSLFFDDAIHETANGKIDFSYLCSSTSAQPPLTIGLAPILLYKLARIAFTSSPDDRLPQTAYRLFPTGFLLWLPNALGSPSFFWSFAALSVSGVQALVEIIARKPSRRPTALDSLQGLSAQKPSPSKFERARRAVLLYLALNIAIGSTSYLHSIRYNIIHHSHIQLLPSTPDPVLVKFLVLSAPRRTNSTLLSSTIRSYTPLPDRFAAIFYTTFSETDHPVFAYASRTFSNASFVQFIHDTSPIRPPPPPTFAGQRMGNKQTADLYSALHYFMKQGALQRTRYVGIMEDDFAWCPDGWSELRALVWEAWDLDKNNQGAKEHCGLFIATGGSGLLIRTSLVPAILASLSKYAQMLPPDLILQNCLLGLLPECSACSPLTPSPSGLAIDEGVTSGLIASRRMLLRHAGARESTYAGRAYPEERWQCGWRQPFNGRIDVRVP